MLYLWCGSGAGGCACTRSVGPSDAGVVEVRGEEIVFDVLIENLPRT